MDDTDKDKLGQILIEKGYIKKEELEDALDSQENSDNEMIARINKNDIQNLEQTLTNTQDSIKKLDNRIRGNGGEGLVSRLKALETKVRGLLWFAGLVTTAMVSQVIMNVI